MLNDFLTISRGPKYAAFPQLRKNYHSIDEIVAARKKRAPEPKKVDEYELLADYWQERLAAAGLGPSSGVRPNPSGSILHSAEMEPQGHEESFQERYKKVDEQNVAATQEAATRSVRAAARGGPEAVVEASREGQKAVMEVAGDSNYNVNLAKQMAAAAKDTAEKREVRVLVSCF